jgi:hypothetical protein
MGGRTSLHDESPVASEDLAVAAAGLVADGYCTLPTLLGAHGLRCLNASIDAVTAHGWPAVFAWVFDATWGVTRAAGVRHLVAATLGEDAKQISHVWVHVVSGDGGTGWPPHVDGEGGRDGRLGLTIWIALTDAGIDQGCMYVVPRSDAPVMVAAARALPIPAGSALAWNSDVLHWGGARRHAGARRSLSIEFIAQRAAPTPGELPLLPCGATHPLPTLAERVRYIAKVLLEYNAHEPAMGRFAPLAEALLNRAV